VTLTGKLRGQPQSYSWLLQHETATASTSFLVPAWTMAENSQGLAMPFAGRQLLNRAQQSFEAQLDTLAQARARSLVRKDQRQVEQIAKILQELDPENADAPHLLQASHRCRQNPLSGHSPWRKPELLWNRRIMRNPQMRPRPPSLQPKSSQPQSTS
jgi:hypothetical protein